MQSLLLGLDQVAWSVVCFDVQGRESFELGAKDEASRCGPCSYRDGQLYPDEVLVCGHGQLKKDVCAQFSGWLHSAPLEPKENAA